MGSRGPAGPPGKNGDDVSDLLTILFHVYACLLGHFIQKCHA